MCNKVKLFFMDPKELREHEILVYQEKRTTLGHRYY